MIGTEQVTDFKLEGATIGAFSKALNEYMKTCGLDPDMLCESRFHSGLAVKSDHPLPKDYRWLVAYSIEGGSEGYYVHVGAMVPITRTPEAKLSEEIRKAAKCTCEAFMDCSQKCAKGLAKKLEIGLHDYGVTPAYSRYMYHDLTFCKTFDVKTAQRIATEAQRFLTAAMWN